MNKNFSAAAVSQLQDLTDRPGRSKAAEAAEGMGLPDTSSEDWRYSPISDLDTAEFVVAPKVVDAASGTASVAENAGLPSLSGIVAAEIRIVSGYLDSVEVSAEAKAAGLTVEVESGYRVDFDQVNVTKFDYLHQAFSPGAVTITAAKGAAIAGFVVIKTEQPSTSTAMFPHVRIDAQDNSEISVIELQAATAAALSVPVVELVAADGANLSYTLVQANSDQHWQMGRTLSWAGKDSKIDTNLGLFGGRYCRVRTDGELVGSGAEVSLNAAYFGRGKQVHDFRTFQHHKAPHTRSDLLFKGVQDDESGSIYTGLIHIHPDGPNSNAFQTNRNLKLSEDAWAWSVPNLEIENNDVHCSHASTVTPIDQEQQFFLQSRGVKPAKADRLIVAGFFDEAIRRFPTAVQEHISQLVEQQLSQSSALA